MDAKLELLVEKLQEGEEFSKIQSALPTDIFYWKDIFELIQNSTIANKHIFEERNDENQTSYPENNTLNRHFSLKTFESKPDFRILIILWIENLLKNPFEIIKTLSEIQIKNLEQFLMFQLTTSKCIRMKKIIIRCLSLFANHLIKVNFKCFESRINKIELENSCLNKKENTISNIKENFDIFSKLEDKFYLFNQEISEVDFYSFLKHLSKFKTITRDLIKIEESDSIQIKRYKIKILSFITDRNMVFNDIHYLLKFLNINDTKLGWTVSKSIYRMSKFINRQKLIQDLINLLTESIVADEQRWINVMTIISFLVLDQENLNEFYFIEKALRYQNEFYNKRAQLKETALFLLWTLIRSNRFILPNNLNICQEPHQENFLEDVEHKKYFSLKIAYFTIYTALFDIDFISRRAAASVVQELVGKSNIFKNDPNIYLITPENVKRRNQSLEIFDKLSNKENYIQFFEETLYSYDGESREIGAFLIAKYFDFSKLRIRYQSAIEMDGIHLLIDRVIRRIFSKETIENQNSFDIYKNLDRVEHRSLEEIKNFFDSTINSFILNNIIYKNRNMNFACKSYLEIAHYFIHLPPIKDNLLFLASKNYLPKLLYKASRDCFTDVVFSKKVFDNFHKNESFIIMNSKNYIYRENVINKNLNFIENRKSVDTCIYALKLLNAFDTSIQRIICPFLEDYTISFNGDIGYYNRRAALEYFCTITEIINQKENKNNAIIDNQVEVSSKTENEKNLFNNSDKLANIVVNYDFNSSIVKIDDYIIRFLCDKSRKLRDDILKALLSVDFSDFKDLFPFIEFDSFSCLGIRKRNLIFEKFFKKFKDLISNNSYETAYIKSIFDAFSAQNDFFIGINNMFNTCDSKLLCILKKEIIENQNKFYSWGKAQNKLLEFLKTLKSDEDKSK